MFGDELCSSGSKGSVFLTITALAKVLVLQTHPVRAAVKSDAEPINETHIEGFYCRSPSNLLLILRIIPVDTLFKNLACFVFSATDTEKAVQYNVVSN